MAISRHKKEEIVANIKDAIKQSESVVFVNFHGLGVIDTTRLRSSLREENIGYVVAKKSLIKRALESSKIEGDLPVLEGELAIAYAGDLLSPARGVFNFHKKHKDKINILGGVFEGRYMDQSEMTAIASIPPLQVLYGQFVNLINSPIHRFAVVLSEIAKSKDIAGQNS